MKGKTTILGVKMKQLKFNQQITAILNLNKQLQNITLFMTYVEIDLNMKILQTSANEKSACV